VGEKRERVSFFALLWFVLHGDPRVRVGNMCVYSQSQVRTFRFFDIFFSLMGVRHSEALVAMHYKRELRRGSRRGIVYWRFSVRIFSIMPNELLDRVGHIIHSISGAQNSSFLPLAIGHPPPQSAESKSPANMPPSSSLPVPSLTRPAVSVIAAVSPAWTFVGTEFAWRITKLPLALIVRISLART
jgi:hypothetical protein